MKSVSAGALVFLLSLGGVTAANAVEDAPTTETVDVTTEVLVEEVSETETADVVSVPEEPPAEVVEEQESAPLEDTQQNGPPEDNGTPQNNGPPEDLLCDYTGDGWQDKEDYTGTESTVEVDAPEGYLIDGYCVKAGTEPIFVPVDPPLATVVIDHPNKDSVSHYQIRLVEKPEPPTAVDCTTTGSFLVTNLNEQGFNYSPAGSPYADTRVDGQYEYVDGALRLTTLNPNDASSTNKVSGARAVNIPLAQYGGSFAMNFVASYGTILPGINVRLDADNDGDIDVTLVAEPGVPGYLTFWTNTPGYLPASLGGQGGAYAGDQDDILALWPNAVVKVEAFALGSGVGTDGDLVSWSTPCNSYTYDYVEEEPFVDATGFLTSDCDTELQSAVIGVEVENSVESEESVNAFVRLNGDPGVSSSVAPGATFEFEFNLEFDNEVTSWTAELFIDGVLVDSITVDKEDCATIVVPPSPMVKLTSECGSATVEINYPAVSDAPGFNTSATALRTWIIKAGDTVLDTVNLSPGESFKKTYPFAEDFNGGSIVVTVGEVDAPVEPLSVTVDTDCEPPVVPPVDPPDKLAYTGSEGIAGGISAAIALLTLGSGLVLFRRRQSLLSAIE